eukprot:6196369-Pleurochrysis_carterae.AAC.2
MSAGTIVAAVAKPSASLDSITSSAPMVEKSCVPHTALPSLQQLLKPSQSRPARRGRNAGETMACTALSTERTSGMTDWREKRKTSLSSESAPRSAAARLHLA